MLFGLPALVKDVFAEPQDLRRRVALRGDALHRLQVHAHELAELGIPVACEGTRGAMGKRVFKNQVVGKYSEASVDGDACMSCCSVLLLVFFKVRSCSYLNPGRRGSRPVEAASYPWAGAG